MQISKSFRDLHAGLTGLMLRTRGAVIEAMACLVFKAPARSRTTCRSRYGDGHGHSGRAGLDGWTWNDRMLRRPEVPAG